MNTLHVVYSFPPDPPGGTEIYVAGLCRGLRAHGVESVVAAPAFEARRYEVDGLRVVRYPMHDGALDLEALYADGDPVAIDAFDRLLAEERPDLVHLHALAAACPADLARRSKLRGIPVVFTYHTPTVTCQRGTMLHDGTEVCDGAIQAARCAACVLHHLGGSQWAATVAALVPESAGEFLGRRRLSGGIWTAARMRSLVAHRERALRNLFSACDRIVAPVGWVEQVLLVNGVGPQKIVRSQHGVDLHPSVAGSRARAHNGPLRVAHLARLDPAKGTAILIEALRHVPSASIELDVHTVAQTPAAAEYGAHLRALAGTDRRVRFATPVEPARVIEHLQSYDLLAVPSQVLETGPLVALEAFAAGIPVLGSALGGLSEYVRDGVDGVLVTPHDSVDAWSRALVRLVADPALVRRLRTAVRPPRTMSDVAAEMAAIYEDLTAGVPVMSSAAGAVLPA